MATHSSILVCKIPWTEEPGGLQSMGSKRVGEDLATEQTIVVYLRYSQIDSEKSFQCFCGIKRCHDHLTFWARVGHFFMSVGIMVKTCMPWHRG